jgi:hypothetical protein
MIYINNGEKGFKSGSDKRRFLDLSTGRREGFLEEIGCDHEAWVVLG